MQEKLPAHEYLDKNKIPYQRLEFPPSTEKGAAQVAEALGYKSSQMVKTLVFESDKGERVLVMVGGDRNAVSGYLKKAIGSRNIKLASLEAVKETTGYEVGSVPPFHWQPEGFRSFVDASLMEEEVLGVGAGKWGHEIMIAPQDLVVASRATVVNLTDRT
ncbi:MAG: YbaK/EbsC family protein, partial [Vicinamibacteria bacterium]